MARNPRLIGLGFVAVLALPSCAYQPAGLIDDRRLLGDGRGCFAGIGHR